MLLWVFSTHVHLRSHARVRASSCMELGGVLPQLSCSWGHPHAVAPRGSLLPAPWPGSQGSSGFRLPTLLLCRLGQLESPLTQSGERSNFSYTGSPFPCSQARKMGWKLCCYLGCAVPWLGPPSFQNWEERQEKSPPTYGLLLHLWLPSSICVLIVTFLNPHLVAFLKVVVIGCRGLTSPWLASKVSNRLLVLAIVRNIRKLLLISWLLRPRRPFREIHFQ